MAVVPMRGITTVDISKYRRRRQRDIPKEEVSYDHATIIGLDPGGTTGWSLISVVPEVLVAPDALILDNILSHMHGQVDCGSTRGNLGSSLHSGISTHGEFSGVYDLAQFIRSWPTSAVVIEDFNLRIHSMDRTLLSPVRVTAAVGYAMWKDGRDYHVQSPADAKRVCSDDRLKEWKLYDPVGNLRHARDADRHAILFLRKCKQDRELRELAWPHLYGPRGPYRR